MKNENNNLEDLLNNSFDSMIKIDLNESNIMNMNIDSDFMNYLENYLKNVNNENIRTYMYGLDNNRSKLNSEDENVKFNVYKHLLD